MKFIKKLICKYFKHKMIEEGKATCHCKRCGKTMEELDIEFIKERIFPSLGIPRKYLK